MHELFDIIQDKYSAAYFTETEKDMLFNHAQQLYVNEMLPDNQGGIVNIEHSSLIETNAQPLIYNLTGLNMDSEGKIANSTLQTDLNTLSGDTKPVRAILAVYFEKDGETFPISYTRYNDYAKMEPNHFKKASASKVKYLLESNGLLVRPIDETLDITVSVLKSPRRVSINPVVDCELPEHTHNYIVAIAIESAGVASRDEALVQLNSVMKK